MSTDDLYAAVDRHLSQLFAPEDDALAAAERSVVEAGLPPISVSAAEGKLLHVLARACRAERILEIGTLAAYSTIWMARALPEHGSAVTIEADPKHAEVARLNLERAGLADRVSLRIGGALDVLPELEREGAAPFDMVFIDADKEPYAEYLDWAIRLGRPGTLIVADNVIRGGAILDGSDESDGSDASTAGIRRFNAALAARGGVSAIAIQTVGARGHDGMALAVVLG
jgi:caffeoyl-CoA O-methyltransferase